MGCCFQVLLCFPQMLEGSRHFGLRFVASSVSLPPSMPTAATPFTAAPSPEQGTVDDAFFTILEYPLLSVWTPSVDAKRLHAAGIGVCAKKAVVQAKGPVLARELFQTSSDIDVMLSGSVL